MGSYLNFFLKRELTVIPGFLDKYLSGYYNNTLCNAATWMFLLWYILHVVFDDLLNALLKKMRYKEYVRVRLQRSLWYLGFNSMAFIYCTATLIRNDIAIFNTKSVFDSTNIPPGHLILGFVLVLTFYIHSALWERLRYCYGLLASTYLCLVVFFCMAYFLRFVEGTFRLTFLICFPQILLELTRCTVVLIQRDTFSEKLITGTLFSLSLFTFVSNYLIITPLLFGYPLIANSSPIVAILPTLLIIWLCAEAWSSPLSKAVIHWTTHRRCSRDVIECSLFPPREDATYNLMQMRKEMKEREEKCMSLRKPKNRNAVFQTLKCMVAIKRKLNEKRSSRELKEAEGQEVVGGKLEFNINEQEWKCKSE